jgi:hypothetical protein
VGKRGIKCHSCLQNTTCSDTRRNARGRGVDFYSVLDTRLVCINELLLAVLSHRYGRDSRRAQTLLVPLHPRLGNRFHPATDVVFALGEWLYGSIGAFATVAL